MFFHHIKYFFLYLIVFLPSVLSAESAISLQPQIFGKPIWQDVLVLEDKDQSFSQENIILGTLDSQFQKISSPNLGFSKSTFWVRLTVNNPTKDLIRWNLVFDFPLLDEVTIFGTGIPKSVVKTLGDIHPFSERNLDYRNPVFPLETKGETTSVYYLRIQSESTIPLTLFIWTEREFNDQLNKEQMIFGFFYGILFVMIAYNFFIYIFTYEKSYLFYLFFISSIFFFHLINNGFAFQYLWPNAIFWGNYSLPFFICFACITGLLFSDNYLSLKKHLPKISKLMWVWAGILLLFSGIQFFLSYRIAMITSILLTVPTALVMVFSGATTFFSKVRAARYFLISWTFFLTGVLLYSLKSLGILPDNHITRWTIQIGTALQTILLSLGLADRINFLTRSLRDHIRELSHAKLKIEESEKRFREIFQGSDEVILMMNDDFEIINANRALSKHMGFRLDDLRGKKITEILYRGRDQSSDYNVLYVNDKLTDLKMTGSIVNFKTEFEQKYVKEPKEMYCRLQYINFDETREVLVTMSSQYEDTIIQLIESEKVELSMNNYLRNAEIVSQRITSQLAKYLSNIEQTEVRSSIREIIINAVEHGNLNISFDEKSKALLEGNYLEFLQKRQEDPRYSQKRVKIEYSFASEFVAYRITDEGRGFDHKKHMEKSLEEMNEAHEQHGRGILMTKSVFDRIEYNDRGNQVSLIKFLNKV
ncbi:7TM diverse intracellular signaling domain-containing protein [Leptospira bandrabouensis]|uniref:PAS domain S-box protein n=1 Tax=Leptospira bandrabouensis TaxID=2484903 RepID=A0A6H3NTD0_9LEPT|nr:7TM diverse intracellular signaling domain-containing protein [Leptospira bandrabouensis]MCG6152049.1 ATP-binding protein [Leptospira bandrabouensis]MCW7459684.1 ATP-binding protein [Leptospira bandrabouensis]MCW7477296.1 ATP-binding protein [Leptospira bandrabouensis]MCW7484978.1 ATP-binding protein [Leptospira bandrabouensis]TGN09268.1 PAS domain S-box protein [Leptospira bandrabouensis]